MTRVFVVGGTNFIGPAVVRRLLAEGAEVVVLHRGETEDELGAAVHIHADRSAVADHVAATRPDVILDMAPLHAAHASAIMAAAFLAGVGRVVAVSSLDVYRGFDVLTGREDELQPVPFTEESELRRIRFPHRARFEAGHPMYDYDKLDVEGHVLGSASTAGVVLRLPMVYGPKDRQRRLYPLVRRMTDGMPVIVMSDAIARWRFGKAYREDVAAAIALGCLHPAASGGIYNVGSFAGTEAEWARRVGQVLGWEGHVAAVPADRTPESLRAEGNFAQHLVADSSRIRSELGWAEVADLEEGISAAAEWELANPPPEFSYDRDAELSAAGRA